MLHLAQDLPSLPTAPSGEVSWPMVVLALIAFLSSSGLVRAVVGWINEKTKRLRAEAERDATLRGVDRATARMEAPAAKLAREELRQAQAEAGVQPAIDARLNELRNAKGGGA